MTNEREFQKKKNIILFIHGYACVMCGVISVGNHVHHIDKNHKNNDPFNLCPLCSNCHKQAHKIIGSIKMNNSPSVQAMLEQLREFFS
jgi:5-methylcytosine-specific restriction endonuclease McrA